MVLQCRGGEDQLVWNRSRDGCYSVKSAYYGAMIDLIDSSKCCIPGDWNSLWKLRIPHKVKIHLSRTARSCLPCRYNLCRCRVPCPVACTLCDDSEESEWHLFFGCPHSVDFWRAAGLWNRIEHIVAEAEGYRDCLFTILSSLQEGPRKKFAMMIWAWWERHNEKLWENVNISIPVSITLAMDFLFRWEEAKRSKQLHLQAQLNQQ